MSPQDAGNRNASAPDVREAFLAWIRDDGYLVPSAVTDIEWDDEGLPVYYTRDDGVRHYLDGEWHAWQAATARAALAVAPATAQPVAWAVFAEDASVPAYVSASRNRADQVVDSEAGRIEGYRLVPLYAAPPATGDAAAVRPEVVCLCGSTRFIDTFAEQYGRLTDEGKIVLTVGRVVPQSEQALGSPRKAALDVLHLRKIDLADRVLVLNVGGYVGPSTRREIAYAKERGKPIDLLYPDAGLDGAAPALPLPATATATAVEEARKAVIEKAKRWRSNPMGDAASNNGLYCAVNALLSAEAAATHAAKESRSDDRPASGQGGV